MRVSVKERVAEILDVPISGWKERDQYQLCNEVLKYLDYSQDEIEGI